MSTPHIIIGFSTGKGWSPIPALIRTIEGTEYSHTYIKVWSHEIQDYVVYQESFKGLNAEASSLFNKDNKIINEYAIRVTQEQLDSIMQFCFSRLGMPYGTAQIAGMFAARVLRQCCFKDMKNPLADGLKTMVCSEMVGHILGILGKEIDKDLLEIEGPKMIHKKVLELYNQ